MATTRFNDNVLAATSRVKDARSDPTSAGDANHRWTSAQWARYENQSIRDLLIEWIQKAGLEGFQIMFPEYVKTGTTLVPSSGAVAKPTDAFRILDLKDTSTGLIKFRVLDPKLIQDVVTGQDGDIVPSPTVPYFYEENGYIWLLGLTNKSVTPRYIITHNDIAISTVAAGAGNYSTSHGAYAHTTQTLSGLTMHSDFTVADVNNRIMIYDNNALAVYYARIASYVSTSSVTIEGDGLPAGDIASPYAQVYVATNDINDLVLNPYWYGDIINRMVEYALQDAKNFVK